MILAKAFAFPHFVRVLGRELQHMLAGLAVIVPLALTGCASAPAEPETADPVMRSVGQVIERTQRDLPDFTASSTAKPEPAKEKGPAISLDYAGEARVLLQRLARANSIDFRVYGPQPYLPLFVIVNAKNADFIDVLRDVGEQFGGRAALVLKDGALEVHYRAR